MVLGQVFDDGQQTYAVPFCVTNLFRIVKSKFCAALVLPNTSTAKADTVMELLNTVVDGHDTVHAGVLTAFLPVPVVVDPPVSTCMKRTRFCTMPTCCAAVLLVGARFPVTRADT